MSVSKPILKSKIQVPPLSPNFIPRSRLYDRLDAALQPIKRLTLISAPAGYGKTSLVSAWILERQQPSAWISLDEQDNDPFRFGSYLISSLLEACPEIHPPVLPEGPFSAGEHQEKLLIPLLNELGQNPRTTLIVLDDFHWIQDSAVEGTVEFLLDNLPTSVHIFILTRADPALPIALLRGRGQLNELRMDQLRFQPEEVASLLNGFEDIHLSKDDIQILTSRTEGWIAGLQMAIASLRGHIDQSGFIAGFSGDHQYIMDFLLDEVLRRQTPRLQSFLLNTSILKRLSGPLCDALLESTGEDHPTSDKVLRDLMRANLFVVPLDEQQTWFRYHRLFADLLEARLRREFPNRIHMLHRRASMWFEENEQLEDAMRHAVESKDFELAADLLERISESWLMRSETTTFLRWIQRLPPDEIATRPRLVIFQAWALLFQGAPLRVVDALIPHSSQDDGLPGGSALIRSFVALTQGHIQEGLGLAEKALELLPKEELFLRNFAVFCEAGAQIAAGNQRWGQKLLEETTQDRLQSGDRSAAVIFLTELGEIRMKEMRLDESQFLYEKARHAAMDSEGNLLPIGGRALVGLGTLAMERNDLNAAEALLEEGLERIARWNLFNTLDGHLALASLYKIRGDDVGLDKKLAELSELARRFDATEIDDMVVDLVAAGLRARQGRFTEVLDWLKERGLEEAPERLPASYSEDHLLGRIYKYELPVLIRYLIAEEEFERAAVAIEQLLSLADEANRPFLVLEGLLLEAILLHAKSESKASRDRLRKALEIAAPVNAARLFIIEGDIITNLLCDLQPHLQSPALIAFVDNLLEGTKPGYASIASHGIEALSPRELDVLHLLPCELTAEELAQELYISVNTVRTHMKNIYSKLHVHSRHQAVDKARQQQLI